MRKERRENRNYLRVFVALLFIVWLTVITLNVYSNREEKIQILNSSQQTTAKKYIISKEAQLRKIRACNKTVTLEQERTLDDTYVDIKWVGERRTKLTAPAICQLGFDGYDIEITHIDQKNGIMYIKMGKPILISLNIDFNKINFEKTEGLFRFSMSDKEQKSFYKDSKNNLKIKLLRDKDTMKQVDALNKEAITYLMKLNPNVKGVIYE